jgi:hypothetical protein
MVLCGPEPARFFFAGTLSPRHVIKGNGYFYSSAGKPFAEKPSNNNWTTNVNLLTAFSVSPIQGTQKFCHKVVPRGVYI